jgi:hypothetical protein
VDINISAEHAASIFRVGLSRVRMQSDCVAGFKENAHPDSWEGDPNVFWKC